MTVRRVVAAALSLAVFWSALASASAATSPSGAVSPVGPVSPSGPASTGRSPTTASQPSLDLPARAAPGSTITVVGRDFIVGTSVAIWLAPARVVGEPAPTVTDADGGGGGFTVALTAPLTNPGDYLVVACQGCGLLTAAEKECIAGVTVGLACSPITIAVPVSTSSVGTATPDVNTVRRRAGHRSSSGTTVGPVVADNRSWSWLTLPFAALALLLAAAVVTVMVRRRRRPRRDQTDARARPMPPPEIEVHDGFAPFTLRLARSLPPADVHTERTSTMNPTLASLIDQTPQDTATRLRGTARRAAATSPVTGARLDDQIAGQVHSLLDRDLVSVLVEGWQSSRALRHLADESREHPDDTFTIELARQRITHVRRPSFDLYVDRRRLATVGFVVTAVLLLPELSAEVVDGAVTSVRFGPGELTVSVSDDHGDEVLPAVHRTFGSSHSLALPRQIPLLDAHSDLAGPPVR